MSVFSYIAKSRHGEELSGHLAGENLDEVIAELHTMGLAVLHIHESRGPLLAGFLNWLRELSPPKASKRELALFSRQLATVLESGIPLSRGLRGLASDKGGRGMGKTILDVCDRIERGESLSKALEAHPAVFNSMYQSMVRAGERAGTLDSVVEHLAVYLEKSDAIRTKVKSALSYPVFIMVFAALAILLMLVKIVPTFAKLYTDLGADLPTLTRIMIESSAFVQGHFL
ncbi:MAG: type II secretion system F family protein, partial [Candidatus Krumholzibacteria bacterium]|nr:type II secretion system F family protein [Candidatus Krumholzibacteria bacterium]